MMPQSQRSILLVLSLLLATASVWSQTVGSDGIVQLGRESGWKDFSYLSGVGFQRAKDGTLDLTLQAAEYRADDDTDLLLHFNDAVRDEASRYRVTAHLRVVERGFSALGGGSAIFRGEPGLSLQATAEGLFAPGKGWGDFTLEFWLYPSLVDDGETIVEWQGGRTSSGTYEAQGFKASFENSHLVWTLQNLFASTPATPAVSIKLSAASTLVPKQWHHHLLRYRSDSGLLEYLIDGKTESLVHATPSGSEDGRPMGLVIGPRTQGELVVGGRYQGALDELRLSRTWVEEPQPDRYVSDFATKGTAVSRIFDLGFPGSTLDHVTVRAFTEGDTAIVWSFRMAETIRYQWTFSGETARSLTSPENELDSWIRFTPGQDLSRLTSGRYLQIRAELLPSGTGTATPRINQMVIKTRPAPPPPSPSGLELIPGDGQITVRWKPVMQGSPDGYLVFFGPRPGQTQGTISGQGASPVNAGKATQIVLSGLANDQIYYVSVAAYRSSAVSAVSRELAARPQRKVP